MLKSGDSQHDPSAGTDEVDLSSPLLVAVHDAYLQVGRTMIERSLSRANIVLTSATAALTAYTALLGLMSSTEHGRRLAPIVFLPVPYLGLTIAFTAIYVGYVAPHSKRFHPLPLGSTQAVAEDRLAQFLAWVHDSTMSRAWALRTALVSLALGLMLLPVGFVALTGAITVLVETSPLALLVVYGGIEILRHNRKPKALKESTHRENGLQIVLPEFIGPEIPQPAGPDIRNDGYRL